MTIPAIALPTLSLSDDEAALLGELRRRIAHAARVNRIKYAYYEGVFRPRLFDIAVPPSLADVEVRCGFPGTVVDVLAERIAWDGWQSAGDLMGLDEIYDANELDVEQAQEVQDSLICGVSFTAVGKGDESVGEPEVLITSESPSSASVLWNARARRADAGLVQACGDAGDVVSETLCLPGETITVERTADGVAVVDRDPHNLGIVPLVRNVNRERASERWGRSEITPNVRYLFDATIRTLLGMEINREFYTAPQRYGLGVDPEMFGLDPDSPATERVRKGWQIAMTRMNFLPAIFEGNEEGDEVFKALPQVGQFQSAPPTPYADQVKFYSQLVSAESAIPPSYLGFSTDNPPSADAIDSLTARLVRRAEFRMRARTRPNLLVARLALLHRDGVVDEAEFAKVHVNWLDAKNAKPAADADRALKLTSGEQPIVPPTSRVAGEIAGLTRGQIDRVDQERRQQSARMVGDALRAVANAQTPQTAPAAPGVSAVVAPEVPDGAAG